MAALFGLFGGPGEKAGARPAFSVEHLQHLFVRLQHFKYGDEASRDAMVEVIRLITEALIWGEKHDHNLFDFFCENNMLAHFVQILERPAATRIVKVQLLQTLSMLVQNIRRDTSLYYLFSNNYVNQLISTRFDWNDEEILGYFISFLKSLAMRLNAETVKFFFNERAEQFPLYIEAIRFFGHQDVMVRAAVRTLTLQVYGIEDSAMQKYVLETSNRTYFLHLACYLRELWYRLDAASRAAAASGDPGVPPALQEVHEEQQDLLMYLSDVLELEVPSLGAALAQRILHLAVFPVVLGSLLAAPTVSADASSASSAVACGGKDARSSSTVAVPRRLSATCALFVLRQVFETFRSKVIIEPLMEALLVEPMSAEMLRICQTSPTPPPTYKGSYLADGVSNWAPADSFPAEAPSGSRGGARGGNGDEEKKAQESEFAEHDEETKSQQKSEDEAETEKMTEKAGGEQEQQKFDKEQTQALEQEGQKQEEAQDHRQVQDQEPDQKHEHEITQDDAQGVAESVCVSEIGDPVVSCLAARSLRAQLFQWLNAKGSLDACALLAAGILRLCMQRKSFAPAGLLEDSRLLSRSCETSAVPFRPSPAEPSAEAPPEDDGGQAAEGHPLEAFLRAALALRQSASLRVIVVQALAAFILDMAKAIGDLRLVAAEPVHLAVQSAARQVKSHMQGSLRDGYLDVFAEEWELHRSLRSDALGACDSVRCLLPAAAWGPTGTGPLAPVEWAFPGTHSERQHSAKATRILLILQMLRGQLQNDPAAAPAAAEAEPAPTSPSEQSDEGAETSLMERPLYIRGEVVDGYVEGCSFQLGRQDRIVCGVVTSKGRHTRYLVLHNFLLLLVQPDLISPGWAAVRTVAPLKQVESEIDKNDQRMLHLLGRLQKGAPCPGEATICDLSSSELGLRFSFDERSGSFFTLSLSFEDVKRCHCADNHVQKERGVVRAQLRRKVESYVDALCL